MRDQGLAPHRVGLIGRERALAQIRSLLAREDVTVVAITGLSGVGKTAVAQTLLDTVPDGWFVPMDAGRNPQAVRNAVVLAAAARRRPRRTPSETPPESVGNGPIVVLDDADRYDDLAGTVADLTSAYPGVRVVLTATRPTRIPGERVVTLRPLPVPTDAAGPDHPCVRLFVERAAEVGATFDLADPVVHRSVIGVCRQTGGLPLAVELAAARTPTQPLRFIERTLLHSGSDPGSGPAESLFRSLRWATSMLSDAASGALSQAALFASSFQLDAASAVIELPDPNADVYDALSELVDAYLLEFDTDVDDETRFVMQEPVRAFALSRLGPDDLEAAQARHAHYFRDRARAGGAVAAHDWPDITRAMDWAIRRGVLDDVLVRGIAATPAVRRLNGVAAELRARFDELAAHPDSAHPDAALRARAMVWSTQLFPADADELASVGVWTADQLATEARLARESGDRRALLEALEMTVRSVNVTLDIDTATAAAHEGLDLAQRSDDRRVLARFETWGAMAALQRDNVLEAARLASLALAHGRECDEPIAVIWASRMLWLLPETIRPRPDPPIPDLRTVLEWCESTSQELAGMTVMGDLSRLDAARGDVPAAAGWACRQLMVAAGRVHSDPLATAIAVANVVSMAVRVGDAGGANRLRSTIQRLESLFPAYMPPQIVAAYQADCRRLLEMSSGDEESGRRLPCSMAEANRDAQEWLRGFLAGASAPLRRSRGSQTIPRQYSRADAQLLTVRQRDVLALLASGATNNEIADALNISAKTVMHHSVAIYQKLGVRGRAAAAAWATRTGLVGAGRGRSAGR